MRERTRPSPGADDVPGADGPHNAGADDADGGDDADRVPDTVVGTADTLLRWVGPVATLSVVGAALPAPPFAAGPAVDVLFGLALAVTILFAASDLRAYPLGTVGVRRLVETDRVSRDVTPGRGRTSRRGRGQGSVSTFERATAPGGRRRGRPAGRGRDRGLPNDPARDGLCAVCNSVVGDGERRVYAKQSVALGVPLRTLDRGENEYCADCAGRSPLVGGRRRGTGARTGRDRHRTGAGRGRHQTDGGRRGRDRTEAFDRD